MEFDLNTFYGYLVQGDLRAALAYAGQFPEAAERVAQYRSRFEQPQPADYPIGHDLNGILTLYQEYYREVFYLGIAPAQAAQTLSARLAACLGLPIGAPLDEIEEAHLVPAFRSQGLHFLGGRTGGFYGPYIWRDTREQTYEVTLPEGIQAYPVRFLRGFLSKSWLDYLSFGAVSTGGWTGGDGIICCIEECYDTESEAFRVSLLCHEAQHARDLAAYPGLDQETLEYRAKLVELICSQTRHLLPEFAAQAGTSNGHARAAQRITREFAGVSGPEAVRTSAQALFSQSSVDILHKKP